MLTAEAMRLADLSGLAEACAVYFCAARCAGCDIRAIAPAARAAVRLGASVLDLHQAVPPFASDEGYLEAVREAHVLLRQRIRSVDALAEAAEQAVTAAWAAMSAAARADHDAAYAAALREWRDATAAMQICAAARDPLTAAALELRTATAIFGVWYERPEQFVAAGGVMPRQGRWITGEKGSVRA